MQILHLEFRTIEEREQMAICTDSLGSQNNVSISLVQDLDLLQNFGGSNYGTSVALISIDSCANRSLHLRLSG
jgi:hypothetical protein